MFPSPSAHCERSCVVCLFFFFCFFFFQPLPALRTQSSASLPFSRRSPSPPQFGVIDSPRGAARPRGVPPRESLARATRANQRCRSMGMSSSQQLQRWYFCLANLGRRTKDMWYGCCMICRQPQHLGAWFPLGVCHCMPTFHPCNSHCQMPLLRA